MATHKPDLQLGENGPLAPKIRKRIETTKNKLNLTLAQVGEEFGFSGPFVSTILRDTNPQRVRTKHVDRIVDALEKMEVKAGLRTATSAHVPPPVPATSVDLNGGARDLSMQDLIRAAHRLGFEVSFKPL